MNLFDYQRYLLVIPHPDDEVSCCALLHQLVQQGKQLQIILLTTGDAGENPQLRGHEMQQSLDLIGLDNLHFSSLGISEKHLFSSFSSIYQQLHQVITDYQPDCLLTQDFDGGHEGHDSSNFIAHQAIDRTITHIVYPDYHFRNLQRHGMEFLPDRHPDTKLTLTSEETDLKIALLQAHSGQISSYLKIQKNQPNYFDLLLHQELYRIFPADFDYLAKPTYQIGYEYHRNGFKFADFHTAAKQLLNQITNQK